MKTKMRCKTTISRDVILYHSTSRHSAPTNVGTMTYGDGKVTFVFNERVSLSLKFMKKIVKEMRAFKKEFEG